MRSKNVLLFSTFAFPVLLLFLSPQTPAATTQPDLQIAWTQQLGTADKDVGNSIATDAYGNIFISGWTTGDLGGVNSGDSDAFVSKYNAAGSLEWTRQFGEGHSDESYGVATDLVGNIYVAGTTYEMPTANSVGGNMAFLAKYDTTGSLLWMLPNDGDKTTGYARGVVTDTIGNVYITGSTGRTLEGEVAPGGLDAFVAKYTPEGTLCWKKMVSTDSQDSAFGIAADSAGNVYITGDTRGAMSDVGNLGSLDVFLTKFSSDGILQWTQQWGTDRTDIAKEITVDTEGNIYISGCTGGSLGGPSAGNWEAFISKFDADGHQEWSSQIGTKSNDDSYAVAVNASGKVYIGGRTNGVLGDVQMGMYDAFFCQYDSDGDLHWIQQFGTNADDWMMDMTTDATGNLFAVGSTNGTLGGANFGAQDVFLIKFQSVPEPSSIAMIGCLMLTAGWFARRRHRVHL